MDGLFQDDKRIVPAAPNITKGWHDKNIRKNFNKITGLSGKNGIAIENLGWVESFVKIGVNVCEDYGLNLYNGMDFLLAQKLGLKEAVNAHEAELTDIAVIDFNPRTCKSVILSHKDTNLLMQKNGLKKAGIKRFRIYAE